MATEQQNKKPHPLLKNILILLLIVAAFLGARFLLGTYTMMYLSANDIDHVEVVVSPEGGSAVSTGDDTAALVKLLRKVDVHYAQEEAVAGQAVSLTLFNHDGTQMQVVLSGSHVTIDGEGYKCGSKGSQKVADWANGLLEKQ